MDAGRVQKEDEDSKRARRWALRELNANPQAPSKSLDSTLKRHTAFTKRLKQSVGSDNRDFLLKEIESLALEKYVDEIVTAVLEGVGRCKTERDVWAATEVISALHRRLPFTPKLLPLLQSSLSPPPRNAQPPPTMELQERETASRITRQRPILRVACELALVGVIVDQGRKSGGEWVMKSLRDLLSHDTTLSSLPLLITFLKGYGRPFLGILPSSSGQNEDSNGPPNGAHMSEEEELVEKDVREKSKRMCEGYYEGVSKILVKEHHRLQEQEHRNHEAYIRSGEIFEDRQQAYEKQLKAYEKLLTNTQTLSEILFLPMPNLPTNTYKADTISITIGGGKEGREGEEIEYGRGSKWEDEEERRFYEDLRDLKDWVPRSFLNIPEEEVEGGTAATSATEDVGTEEKEREDIERLEPGIDEGDEGQTEYGENESRSASPTPGSAQAPAESMDEAAVAPGPSQVLTGILGKLPEASSRDFIDEAAVEFMFVNSKAARKRLIKFLMISPKQRTDLIPYYGRLVATISRYAPDLGKELLKELEGEFRYLQRKKKVVKELAALRTKNTLYFSTLTKFGLVPTHVILHIINVFLNDLSGSNVECLAMLLEGCGRWLLRGETGERMGAMLELMKRKQSAISLDQRQVLLLENAYYQCNPPDRGPIEHKQRPPLEQFIRHLVYDVLSKRTLDTVLKALRKLPWSSPSTLTTLYKIFTKPHKASYSNITLLAMLLYDLQRWHSKFVVDVVDRVLEDVRSGMERNAYKENQRRVSGVRYLGELYIYRLVNSRVVFDTLWSLVTFGHNEGRPLPGQVSPIDAPDDFFRIRLVCTLLDSCGMCFDRGSYMRKLDRFLTFFQLYILTKDELPMDIDFMVTDTLEALRPKLVMFKTFEEAASAVDEMFESTKPDGEESGDESADEEERSEVGENEEVATVDDQASNRPTSPDHLVLLDAKDLGPTDAEAADFDKELSRMLSDAAADAKKVDRKAALSAWDTGVTTTGSVARKINRKEVEKGGEGGDEEKEKGVMRFAVLSKRGKNATRELEIPTSSTLAAQTLSAQIQNKQEQEQLKRLVLDYEQREELAEMKALESSMRSQGIRVRFGS